jgi:uncharacterized protein (DUF885 family)
MTGSDAIAALADEFLKVKSDASPLWASMFGVDGYDGAIDDLSEDGDSVKAAALRDLQVRAEKVDRDALSDSDRVTQAVLLHEARTLAEGFEDGHAELIVSGHASPVSALFQSLPKMPAEKVDGLEARLRQLPTYLAQAGERMQAGVAKGRGPHMRGLQGSIAQVESYLTLPVDQDPFLQPAVSTAAYDSVHQVIADEVRPAFHGLLEVLLGVAENGARSDERPGMAHVPGGDPVYRRALAAHTTTTRTPEEIHQTGLDLVAQLREEYARLGQSVFGDSDVDRVIDRLRHDKGLRYATPVEMLTDARGVLARAEQALPQYFGTYHRTKCEVEEMSVLEAPTAVLGYYIPPASDGSRPGRHWLNTDQPETRTRYEYETLAFHESVPGHHLQFAVAQELGDSVPAFRRFGYVAAFGEGWGLYTERLCDEMGLYSGDLARFGMVSFDSWRATRLVVDTGIHHLGWSRQQAIDYMWNNSALTMQNIVNEVDRYISWFGQANAYMIGRLEIDSLRAQAKQELGAAFDIKGFHDAVLLNGSIPLTVLHDEVTRKLGLSRSSSIAPR